MAKSKLTDIEKIVELAEILKDSYSEHNNRITIPAWRKRFWYNSQGEITQVDEVRQYANCRKFYKLAKG